MFSSRIICIHGINKSFTKNKLERYVKWMKFLSFEFINIESALLKNRKKRLLVLTVDDGYRNCITELLPVLEKHEITATLFVAPGLLGLAANDPKLLTHDCYLNEDIMSMEELMIWVGKGHRVGFHTDSHISLYETEWKDVVTDFTTGMNRLRKNEINPIFFAYPRGFLPLKCNREKFEELLIDNGIDFAFTIAWGDINLEEPLYINRVCLGDNEPVWWSVLKSIGLLDWYYKWKTRDNREIK